MVQPTYEADRKTETSYVPDRKENNLGKVIVPLLIGIGVGWAFAATGNYLEDYRPGGPGNNTSPYLKSPGLLPGDKR